MRKRWKKYKKHEEIMIENTTYFLMLCSLYHDPGHYPYSSWKAYWTPMLWISRESVRRHTHPTWTKIGALSATSNFSHSRNWRCTIWWRKRTEPKPGKSLSKLWRRTTTEGIDWSDALRTVSVGSVALPTSETRNRLKRFRVALVVVPECLWWNLRTVGRCRFSVTSGASSECWVLRGRMDGHIASSSFWTWQWWPDLRVE